MFSCFRHLLFDCFWYRRQAVLFITAEDIVPADGGGGAVPANEDAAAPAPAAAQTTNTTDTNVNAVDLTRPWSHGEWNEWARRDE